MSGGAKPPASRLLVVEDRESLRRMLARALAGEGYAVESAADRAAGGGGRRTPPSQGSADGGVAQRAARA
jgi:ActR/RegA family two-component response regulator